MSVEKNMNTNTYCVKWKEEGLRGSNRFLAEVTFKLTFDK